ncbi:DNA invertase Pin-like site-specific DNA recombinase [Evansella vedderi]|uniref:DNA invertase Pin-like site-specific DNA recombinase n=1 Tax=Evansella vedderi TaxID=38282 RepID=A0ABT9ZRU6_9BACI|nr:recombinase family protein [Evansella vedderi]MDQ0253942.1 DNA invertase Pin-like site-specific DNA recombinase [Evansella vedderi]
MNANEIQLKPFNVVNTLTINPPTSQYSTTYGGDRIMRCVLYVRVSTEMETQRTSIDNQIDLFRSYAAQKNWEIVEIYTDKQSGTKGNRPGLKKLIEDGKAGLYDVILAKELSRLARNGRLSYELRDTCLQNDIHIVCLDNSINTITGNVQNFGLFAWLYENESANSSRRGKAAIRTKANRGLFVGSNPPYGYYSDNGTLKIRDDNTPDIVRRIFNEYLDGKGMDSIAKSFTAERIPTPSQIAHKSNASPLWHASTIKNILNNQHYCGDLVQNRTETVSVTTSKRRINSDDKATIQENTHEPIILKETFQAVQKMLQTRTRTNTAPKKHLFTNVLFCEHCQKGMWFKANQKGYRCGGNIKYGDTFCQNRVVVREKELKHIIIEDLQELFKSIQDDEFLKSLQKRLEQKKVLFKKELAKIENKATKFRSRKKDYLDMYADELISREELVEYRKQIDLEISNLESAKSEFQEKLDECESENYAIDLGKKLQEVSILNDLSPQLLHSLVNNVTCSDNGNLHIHYNFVKPF